MRAPLPVSTRLAFEALTRASDELRDAIVADAADARRPGLRSLQRAAALVAKWRAEADGVAAQGYSQQADRMTDCARALAVALGLEDA